MATSIAKWGNSLAVRIPQNLAKEVNLAEGSEVDVTVVDGCLLLKPRSSKKYSLEEMVEAITAENLHAEVDSGIAVGNEIW